MPAAEIHERREHMTFASVTPKSCLIAHRLMMVTGESQFMFVVISLVRRDSSLMSSSASS